MYFLIISLPLVASAGSATESDPGTPIVISGKPTKETGTLGKAEALADLLIKVVPSEKLSCSMKALKDLVRPSAYNGDNVGGPNEGFVAYYRELLQKNPCFAQTAQTFWKEVSEFMAADPAASTVPSELSKIRTPGLMERAGQGRFANFKPGWLWERAIKASGGNPNVAMALVGICGHDYGLQDQKMTLSPEQSEAYARSEIKHAEEQIEILRAAMSKLETSSPEWQAADHKLSGLSAKKAMNEYLIKGKVAIEATLVKCPEGTSAAFANQSVDPSLDLPDEFKKNIAKVQRPGGDGQSLPSKSYHYMAGANIGCLLAKCGVSPETAGKLAGQVAQAYRALRLCPKIKDEIRNRNAVADKLDISPNDPKFREKAIELLRERFSTFGDIAQMNLWDLYETERQGLKAASKFPKTFKPLPQDLSEKTLKLRERAVENALDSYDAATLYSKWYFGGPDSLLPCTSIRGGPADLNEPDISKDRAPHQPPRPHNSCGIAGWSVERCGRARLKLSTWDIDFTWTAKQQEIGARFGAEKCRPEAEGKNFDQRLCPAGFKGTLQPVPSWNETQPKTGPSKKID